MTEEQTKSKIEGTAHKEAVGQEKPAMIAVIRIAGMVKVRSDVAGTLDRLRLRRKYSCVIVDKNNKDIAGMLKRVKQYIAFGEIDQKTLEKLVKERAESEMGRKHKVEANPSDVASGILSGKKLSEFKLKPFFRLHPPRKGIDSKLHYPIGVLGNNKKDINKLIARML
jgi:large subunit ribosomal protein L30